jgi:Tfp pilus assembly protein PilV
LQRQEAIFVWRLVKSLKKNQRRGVSIVECLILMIILAVTIGAIMETVAWSMHLQTSSRENMGAYLFINNWFETLESFTSEEIASGDFSSAAGIRAMVEERMGKKGLYKFEVTRGPVAANGVYTVCLRVRPSQVRTQHWLVVSRDINMFSTATAPDNAQRN